MYMVLFPSPLVGCHSATGGNEGRCGFKTLVQAKVGAAAWLAAYGGAGVVRNVPIVILDLETLEVASSVSIPPATLPWVDRQR